MTAATVSQSEQPALATGSAEDIEKPPEAVQMTDAEELDAANDKDHSDSGKLKTLIGILKRMIGVKDMAAIRLSLPANLLEPVPNLEYWNYIDRGDIFSSIGELDDPLDRMLQVLRFTFTKELKFVHGKVCKPYNSILGEHFRCHWDIQGMRTASDAAIVPVQNLRTAKASPLALSAPLASSSASSVGSTPALSPKTSRRSDKSAAGAAAAARPEPSRGTSVNSVPTLGDDGGSSAGGGGGNASNAAPKRKGLSRLISKAGRSANASSSASVDGTGSRAGSSKNSTKSPVLAATDEDGDDASVTSTAPAIEKLSLTGDGSTEDAGAGASSTLNGHHRRITFLTEQVSHHPPISSFFVECKDTGTQLYGVDQLSAKFTGTSVKVFPGEHNRGIFVRLTEDSPLGRSVAGEEYQITHPTASINGLLRGSLWVAICDSLYVTCRKPGASASGSSKQLRTIVEYKDESWLLKAKYAVEAVIYTYEAGKEESAEEFKSIKEVPQDRVVATIEGTWKGKITWKRKGDRESRLLIDLDEIDPLPKTVRPLTSQDDMESRQIWQPVTKAIIDKDFSSATKHKQVIEQRQRDLAAERKRNGRDFVPQFFEADISDGRPKLTSQGRQALDQERDLVGYAEGQNTPEATKDATRAASTATKGPSAQANQSGASKGASGDAEHDDDDDDDDDDDRSFRSAE
ncbi:unnamed protein product [Parajaminaea phylloscopi]